MPTEKTPLPASSAPSPAALFHRHRRNDATPAPPRPARSDDRLAAKRAHPHDLDRALALCCRLVRLRKGVVLIVAALHLLQLAGHVKLGELIFLSLFSDRPVQQALDLWREVI